MKTTNGSLRLNKNIVRVIRLETASTGQQIPVMVYEKGGRSRKVSKKKRTIERMIRRGMRGQAAFSESYLARHNRSNERKKDGFLKDFKKNFGKAFKAGRKQSKLKLKLF